MVDLLSKKQSKDISSSGREAGRLGLMTFSIYVQGTIRGSVSREREFSHPLVHLGWLKLKLGATDSLWVSRVVAGAQALEPSSAVGCEALTGVPAGDSGAAGGGHKS